MRIDELVTEYIEELLYAGGFGAPFHNGVELAQDIVRYAYHAHGIVPERYALEGVYELVSRIN